MPAKRNFNEKPFKLQVYVDHETVQKLDKICEKQGIYRSTFVHEAIQNLFKKAPYKELLVNKRKKK